MLAQTLAEGSSPVHRLDPRARLLVAAALSVCLALLQSLPAALAGLGLGLTLLVASQPPRGLLCRRLAALNLFLLFLCLLTLACVGARLGLEDYLSLSRMFGGRPGTEWLLGRAELLLIPVVIFALLLVENCRIPVDDPDTHLELTMIHEVMILDHSGPNLAFILYGSALKMWFFAALLAGIIVPDLSPWLQSLCWLLVILAVAVVVGVLESVMARLRMWSVPKFLGSAGALAALALILTQIR